MPRKSSPREKAPTTPAATAARRRPPPWLALAAMALLLAAGLYFALQQPGTEAAAPSAAGSSVAPESQPALVAARAPTYVGGAACASCHAKETEAWQGSHHDRAMAVASESSVLGRFDGTTFRHQGVTSTFFRRDGKFFVNTDGPDGKRADFEITHTFGVAPLQQYLVPLPGGRLQALGIAWDSRPAAQGGQRWFHLYPDRKLEPGDPLHWTGIDQVWNYQCADCHSTNLRKNYDETTNTYATTWTDINVNCEACHGPASNHVAWANREGDWSRFGGAGKG
ncbi:MAG TPA: multiheme c-type cytochrome, partial [Rubrivivax sp.]|nr:multiheme c-type cytochrome [Rubrivivax sp.]